eukprot:scaffold26225_cov61-Attheya_sp.AAC.8
MAARYHADATDIPNGAPSITSHTPNTHDNGTSSDQLFQSNIVGVSLFDDDKNAIVQNELTSPRTDTPSGGTPSFATHTPIHHTKGTTDDVANPRRESVREK